MSSTSVPVSLLLSDVVLDRTLDFLEARAGHPLNLPRWDLKAALIDALHREGLDIDVGRT